MNRDLTTAQRSPAGVLMTVVLAAMAGGLAWGIRGQYGHETGAMIAGVLVGFVLVLLHGGHLSSLASARAVALFALGISVGGSMTYGQTVGLTHDEPLINNYAALRWGMLGLAIKGGVWIGLGGALFGMGLSGRRYRAWELVTLAAILVAVLFLGVYLLNRPFDPASKKLPAIYFSDHWHWEPDVDKPRLERWGGLWFVLATLLAYLSIFKRDWLAVSLALWGTLGGALGFPAGQAVQAFHAWNANWIADTAQGIVLRNEPDLFTAQHILQHFNWWNMMETTFGFIFGAAIGLGVWTQRQRIGANMEASGQEPVTLSPLAEWILVIIHVRLLIAWNFQSIDAVDLVADHALPMIILPMAAVMTGRYWPFLVCLPIVMLPIAGKTMRQLAFVEQSAAGMWAWDVYMALPLTLATCCAWYFALQSAKPGHLANRWFAPVGLLLTTWLYFSLNFAFFHVPWPWRAWTGRTPNGLIFLAFSVCLTMAAVRYRPRTREVQIARAR